MQHDRINVYTKIVVDYRTRVKATCYTAFFVLHALAYTMWF